MLIPYLRQVERGNSYQRKHAISLIRNGTRAILDLRTQYRDKMEAAGASAHALKIVDDLFVTPAVTVTGVAKRLRVTYPTAELLVRKLVRANILSADKTRRRN